MGKHKDSKPELSKSPSAACRNCHDNVHWLRDICACRTKQRRRHLDAHRAFASPWSDSARFSPFAAHSTVGMSIAYFYSKSMMTAVRRFVEANAGCDSGTAQEADSAQFVVMPAPREIAPTTASRRQTRIAESRRDPANRRARLFHQHAKQAKEA
jgi:hypothetical protein